MAQLSASAGTRTTAIATGRSGPRFHRSLLVLQVLTSLFFFGSSVPKLIGHSSARTSFDAIGWGDWFMYLTGSLEFAGAIGLLVPLLAGLAGTAYIGLLIGAFITQVTVMNGENWGTPLLVMIAVALIGWGRRARTAELFRLLSGKR